MKQNHEVYLFGQILGTHSFLLKGGFLQPDEYSEIAEQYFLPGGETGTAATVLASLGVSVRMDGTWIGTEVAPMLKAFYAGKTVDLQFLGNNDDEYICLVPDRSGDLVSGIFPLFPLYQVPPGLLRYHFCCDRRNGYRVLLQWPFCLVVRCEELVAGLDASGYDLVETAKSTVV